VDSGLDLRNPKTYNQQARIVLQEHTFVMLSPCFVRRIFVIGVVALSLGVNGSLVAQGSGNNSSPAADKAANDKNAKAQESPAVDPLKRPLTEKQRKEQEKAFKKEVGGTYKKWLDQDVRWIISDEERTAFRQLSNDEERDQFIEQFWLRRDPTPDTVENEFKEEHYRRIAYANEHFAAGTAGWRTDRGRIYVIYGKPDEIETHPSGGTYFRPLEEGGGQTTAYPFEKWRYRYIEGIGQEINLEFVDACMCNDYHLTMDPSEKDASLRIPGMGQTMNEQLGLAPNQAYVGGSPATNTKFFDKLELFSKINRPPPIKFKDLEEVVTHKISVNLLPFDVRADFVKVTSDTVLMPVTIQIKNRDITFVNKDGVQRGTVHLFGRLTTLTGRVSQTFEDTVQVDVPAELLKNTLNNVSVYWKALPLRPGRYRMDLVLKDVNGDRMGTWSRGMQVPAFEEDKLASSSLIVADLMEKVPAKSVGAGSFIIGSTKVRPRLDSSDGKPASFKRQQRLNFWMQVYNLGIDQQTHKSSATIEYDVINSATNKAVVHAVESTEQLGNAGEQVTLEKSFPLASLEPGLYRISIKVNDRISKQTITPSARFAVE
jgi:GWxTD domain-containing protein